MPDDPSRVALATGRRAGWGFIALYTLAYISTSLLFLAPQLVTLALKVRSLVGAEQAPNSLGIVTGAGPSSARAPSCPSRASDDERIPDIAGIGSA